VDHGTKAAVETVFATRRFLINRNLGLRTQNPRDSQDLPFGCSLKGKNVGVLTFEPAEFIFGCQLVAGKEAAGQKEHVNKQNSENSASHSGNFRMVFEWLNYILVTRYFKVRDRNMRSPACSPRQRDNANLTSVSDCWMALKN
jgi:hypothetical protein